MYLIAVENITNFNQIIIVVVNDKEATTPTYPHTFPSHGNKVIEIIQAA